MTGYCAVSKTYAVQGVPDSEIGWPHILSGIMSDKVRQTSTKVQLSSGRPEGKNKNNFEGENRSLQSG